MIRSCSAALTALLVLSSAGAQGLQSPEEELAEIQQILARAWVERDRATVESILADEWSVTTATGQILSRAQVLAEAFESSARRITAMTVADVVVLPISNNDAAVVRGRTTAQGTYAGESVEAVIRFTDVFVRRDGRWQAVASHASPVTAQ